MQIHVIFALPSLVPLSLGALGSCPSRLPLDPPLKGGEVEEREGKTGEGEGEEIRGKGGKGREGRAPPPNILLHPQFQFSRNMPDQRQSQL